MSLRILIVDDTKFLRLMLNDILTKSGYEVVGQAENGLIGVEMYRELRPDLVIMDITMPEMDGITALTEIRGMNPHSVILICSAMSQRDLISKALKAGANQYVMKPFEPERVNEVINEVMPLILNSQELLRQEQEQQQEVNHRAAIHEEEQEIHFLQKLHKQESESTTSNLLNGDYLSKQDAMVHIVNSEPVIDDSIVYEDSSTVLSQLTSGDEEEFGSLLEQEAKQEMFQVDVMVEERDTESVTTDLQEDYTLVEDTFAEHVVNRSELLTTAEIEQLLGYVTDIEEGAQPVPSSVPSDDNESDEDNAAVHMEAIADNVGFNSPDEVPDANEVGNTANFISDAHAELKLAEEQASATSQSVEASSTSDQDETIVAQHTRGITMTASVQSVVVLDHDQKRKQMRNVESSIMCRWNDQIEDQDVNYSVVYNELDETIRIDMTLGGNKKDSILLSMDGFSFIIGWLEMKGVKIETYA